MSVLQNCFEDTLAQTCFWGHLESLLGQSVYHSEHSSLEASDGHCSHVQLEGILRETYYWVVEKLSGGERGEKLGVGPFRACPSVRQSLPGVQLE